ncbi:DUF1698 domain-containing protein [Amycolatopsis anabasis]|uniref:DUF1698 domain-containing protein n=1 Tax=Amycolatopsis anabasis TaxID=1840409 RepID=UPI00131C1452|nr:DUF1698 domain-containing protein [Amycolatopsis anabasis]
MTSLSKEERQAAVDAVPYWFHSIDVGDGVVTPGTKSAEFSAQKEWAMWRVPDLTGRSVLDIGAWDGQYSFAAEDAGAARVVALDHYSWSIDFPKYYALAHELRERGERVPDANTVAEAWRPDTLPGKAGFDTARRLRGSKVTEAVLDFAQDDLGSLGLFDVVLFAGVLYHLADPVGALRRLYSVTGDLAVISTHGIRIAGFEDRELAHFFPFDGFNGDPTNWWVPSMKCLIGWCEAAGFRKVEVVLGPDVRPLELGESEIYTAIVHAFR